jgi:ActR/RegA family two-component response regulator
MKDEKKSSIIKEALIDYNTISEAADANAKKRLADEFPDSFNKLLKEELNKNKKAKESYKKLDEAKESEQSDENESNKESDMKNVEETVTVTNTVGKGKPFDQKAKKVQEDVKVTNTVGKSDPFTEKKRGVVKIEEEREKEFMADVESDTPNQSKGDKGVAFKEKIKGPTSGKSISNLKEEFNISGLPTNSVEIGLDNAGEDDDIITIDEIESEIAQMEGMSEELGGMAGLPRQTAAGSPKNQGGDAYTKLVSMRNELDEMIKNMGSAPDMGYNPAAEPKNEAMGLQPNQISSQESDPTGGLEAEITDQDINDVIGGGGSEVPVDEAMGVSYSSGTVVTGKLGDHEGTHGRFRQKSQNESIKLGGLIEENKKLTKKLNETKKQKDMATTLVESYKNALEKYRTQLKEMAVFNTNLAHVNNLLVNESLALTQDDKIKIINGFKKVDTITESQNKYKSILSEMKDAKKTLTESIEHKVSTSIQPSSKQKLDEVVEKTAYANDKHFQRMKNVINIIERKQQR